MKNEKQVAQIGLTTRIKRLQKYFADLRGVWTLVVLSAFVGAATEPLIPALLKPLLDQGFQKGTLDIWMVPVALILLFAVRGLAGYISQIGLTKISNHGLLNMRRVMFEKIQTCDLDLFKAQSSSALSNTLVYEVQMGAVMLVNSLLSLIRNALTLVALTAYLLYLNWMLTLIVTAVFPAVAWVMRALTKRLHALTKSSQEATDKLAYAVEENVLAHRDIRLFGAQESETNRFNHLSLSLQHLAMKSTVAGAAMTPLTQMLAAVALSAVISVALLQSANQGTSVGEFVAFITAMLMIVAPIRQLSEVSNPITRGLAALEKGLELIDSVQSESSGSYSKNKALGDIRFEKVHVSYSPNSPSAIKDFSLQIMPGETIALVGSSGSGKSTLVGLIPRFVKVSSGHIYLDNQDIETWNIKSLRNQFAIVSQSVVMLNESIAANVALGQEINRQKVSECLTMANLSPWINELDQGMDTIVGHNAGELSGGQRQRLAIARALYKDAPILILDEATSALDSESERFVQEALERLMQKRTTLIIAHRLSTIQKADRIIVMDSGEILETGTHSELLKRRGVYFDMYKLGLHQSDAENLLL